MVSNLLVVLPLLPVCVMISKETYCGWQRASSRNLFPVPPHPHSSNWMKSSLMYCICCDRFCNIYQYFLPQAEHTPCGSSDSSKWHLKAKLLDYPKFPMASADGRSVDKRKERIPEASEYETLKAIPLARESKSRRRHSWSALFKQQPSWRSVGSFVFSLSEQSISSRFWRNSKNAYASRGPSFCLDFWYWK